MACTLRHYEMDESSSVSLLPPVPNRMQRLKNLICGGPWGGNNDIALIYWKTDASLPGNGQWVAWVDKPAPKTDPLPEADVSVA